MNKQLILSASLIAMPAIVWADGPLPTPASGSGVFGANRRVITTPNGLNGVRGSFTVPTFRVPTDFYAPLVLVNTIRDGNSANSKPGFYLGCKQDPADSVDGDPDDTAKLDVDAGVIWEPRRIKIGDGSTTVPPGFSIFVFTKGDYARGGVHVNPVSQWRASVGAVGGANANVTQFDLTWRIYRMKYGLIYLPGYGGYLEVNAVGAGAQPTDRFGEPGRIYARGNNMGPDDEQICASTSAMRVKRVVAMNQGGKDNSGRVAYLPTNGIYEEDGSYMRGCVFGGITGQATGEVLNEFPIYGAYDTPTGWRQFSSVFVDQNNTGYYPPGFDQTVGIPLRPLATARKHFEFPGIPVANWDVPGNNSRYDNETVNINLRNARQFVGDLVVPGSSVTSTTE